MGNGELRHETRHRSHGLINGIQSLRIGKQRLGFCTRVIPLEIRGNPMVPKCLEETGKKGNTEKDCPDRPKNKHGQL